MTECSLGSMKEKQIATAEDEILN